MPKKILSADAPTQVQHPWLTTARSVLQFILSTLVGVALGVVTLSAVAPQILEAIQDVLSPEVSAWLAGIVAGIVALGGAITRLMAIPAVNEWLKKIGLGAPNK